MLESLKKWASGWVAFVMIALLILSFAVWGIADYITGGAGGGALATVGTKEITADEFQRAFGNELNALSRQAGRRITYEQARAVGLDSRVLSQLIGSSAVEAHAQELGLALSDETVADGLKSDPNFQNAGSFDRSMVERLRRELNVTERGLIELRRQDELRNQITSALLRATVVPDDMVDGLAKWRGETRVVSYFRIDADKLVKLEEPTDEDLKKTYEVNKRRYITEPRRDLAVLQLSVADLKKKATFTDEELRKAYEQTKHTYSVPEKRRIEQISFKDKVAADKALAEIQSGKDFLEVAKATGAADSDVKLGLKSKSDLIDSKIAGAAFALAKDAVSEVIEGGFTTAVVRITEIVPGKEPSFEDVKDKVTDQIASEWAQSQIRDYYRRVDDGRGEGKPLKEIAEDLDLPFLDLKSITRGNVGADNKPALTVPDANRVIGAGFRGEIGLESEPIQLDDGGYTWVDVMQVTDSKQRPFEEVKNEVKTLWTDSKKRELITELARKFTDRIKAGEDFAKVAEEAGANVEKTSAIGRSTIPDGLTQNAITQSFALRTGEVGHAETADGTTRTVFKLDEINDAPETGEDLKKRLREEILQQLRTDSLASYVAALQARFGVEINQYQLRRATGADQQQ
jgi:peptidyl-prolyl cis-trans isomerase D